MPAYLKNPPAGIPGDVTRPGESNVEPAKLVAASSVYAQAFGIPVKYVAGGIQQFNGGAEVAADFAGILVREVPSESGNLNSGFTDTIPNPTAIQGLLVRGYAAVKCVAGTPARGTLVYIQIVANGGVAVGAFRATSDSSNTIQTTNLTWDADGKDTDNNATVRLAR